jgi:predicted ferric reductase
VGELADNFSLSWRWLKPRQEAMVKKYYALTETETDSYLEEVDYLVGELRLLTFHLDIREKAKKRKAYIPFGLGEKTFDELKKVEDKWGKYLG